MFNEPSLDESIKDLLSQIRLALSHDNPIQIPHDLPFEYNSNLSQVYITLFQEGQNRIRWGAKKATLAETVNRIISVLKQKNNFNHFKVNDASQCHILFEIVTNEYPCNIRNLTTMQMKSPNRFEPGITGLKYRYKKVTRYFMPTDGYTKSIMSVKQVLNYLSKQCGVAKLTNSITERAHLMRREPIDYTFIEGDAYLSINQQVIKLTRGYPPPAKLSKELIYDMTIKSIDWLVDNMTEDGQFLYYYDPYKDTEVDFQHPNRINPTYYNILRHSGGTITLLKGYELSGDERYVNQAKQSIEFFITTFRSHQYNGKYACYPFYNQKSKLGGAGIGLVSLVKYYMMTADETYRQQIDGLVQHILSRVDNQGELIGYYIHPKFNNGKELINPSDEIKKELFSFYYPGEALLGLALYYLNVKDIDPNTKKELLEKSELALDFLVNIRPVKYANLFEPLPSDAWLMQAIEEWVKVDSFKKQSYIDFVFNDTAAIFNHMYTEENTGMRTKDYIGGFYYRYGDHVYHDASRCEGVISAYFLAKYLQDQARADWIMQNMLISAQGLVKTFYNETATYAHKNKRALHAFRFKLTRQWVRVDSVQHAACFYSRLYAAMND
jgi:hypothetical protein